MSRETATALAAASSAAKLQEARKAIEAYRTARTESALDLASIIEPLAEAIVLMTEEAEMTFRETREAIRIDANSIAKNREGIEKSLTSMTKVAEMLRQAPARPAKRGASASLWKIALLSGLTAPVVAAVSIACWTLLGGPAMLVPDADILQLGRQVQERYQMMPPERQAKFNSLLANPTGR